MSIALSVELFCFAACACQCTSNRREFCCSLANSLAKLIENHCENRPKIDPRRHLGAPKIKRKSLPGPSRETPRRARASRRRLGSVSGASPACPGGARRVPEGGLGRRKGRPGELRDVPRRRKSTPRRARERKNRIVLARLVRGASSDGIFIDVRRFSVLA